MKYGVFNINQAAGIVLGGDMNLGAKFYPKGHVLTAEDILGDAKRAKISYPYLYQDIKPGDMILLDDGNIELKVEKIKGEEICTRVINGGIISDRKGVNTPGVHLGLKYLSEADQEDILFGLEHVEEVEDVGVGRGLLHDVDLAVHQRLRVDLPHDLDGDGRRRRARPRSLHNGKSPRPDGV